LVAVIWFVMVMKFLLFTEKDLVILIEAELKKILERNWEYIGTFM
jgi:hypothetical protein